MTRAEQRAADMARIARPERIVAGEGTRQEAREAAGLTIPQAGRVLGWHWSRVAAIETGAQAPSVDELAAMAKAYGVAGFGRGVGR